MKLRSRSQARRAALAPLLTYPNFRRFWAGQVLSNLGSGTARVALILAVQQQQGIGIAVGALLFVETLPRLFGPVLGAVADRLDRRRLMIRCDVAQAILFAIIALAPPFGVVLCLVAAASTTQTLFAPARLALLPSLVDREDLPAGNSLMGIAFNLQVALGPIVGAVLFAAFGIEVALLVNTASFLGSAVALARVKGHFSVTDDGGRGLRVMAREGLTFALAQTRIRALTIGLLLSVSFLALDDVALVFLVRDTLGGSSAAYGFVVAAFGVGMVAASAALLILRFRDSAQLYLLALVASGLGAVFTGLAPIVAIALVAQAIAGAGNGVDNIASETLIQQEVPDHLLGRVFGVATTAANLGAGLAALLGGVMLEFASPRTVMVIGGAGALVVALVLAGPLRRTTVPQST